MVSVISSQEHQPIDQPPMKIILFSIGTRGDMEPFLAIGELLKDKGHRVICAFPEQFRDLAEDTDLEFATLGTSFIESLESDAGKAAMGGSSSGLKKFFAYIKLAVKQTEINKELVFKQNKLIASEKPDRIVYNGKSVVPIIWELENRGKTILISSLPYMHYVKDHTHVAFHGDWGSSFNKLTYALANFGLVTTVMISKNWLKTKNKIRRRDIKKILSSNKAIYTISPSLFPRPDYWNENRKVLGYHERKKTMIHPEDENLIDFLERHDDHRILFITFGSMTNPQPEKKTSIILDILKRHRIPAVINTASGGLVRTEPYDSEWIHFVSQIPYDWILPKIYAVIHHGGSGTTHIGLRHGCATLIIPHIIDQFVWSKIISTSGAGPQGIKVDKISTKRLEPKMLDLMHNTVYKKKAQEIAAQMEKESFRNALYESIIG